MKGYVVVPNEVVDKLNLSSVGMVMALKGQGLEKFTYSDAQKIRRGVTMDEFEEAWRQMKDAEVIKADDEKDVNSLYSFTF